MSNVGLLVFIISLAGIVAIILGAYWVGLEIRYRMRNKRENVKLLQRLHAMDEKYHKEMKELHDATTTN